MSEQHLLRRLCLPVVLVKVALLAGMIMLLWMDVVVGHKADVVTTVRDWQLPRCNLCADRQESCSM